MSVHVNEFVRVEQRAAERRQAVFANQACVAAATLVVARARVERRARNARRTCASDRRPLRASIARRRTRACCSMNALLSRFSACSGVVLRVRFGAIWPRVRAIERAEHAVRLHARLWSCKSSAASRPGRTPSRVVNAHVVVVRLEEAKPGPPMRRSSLPLTARIASRIGSASSRRGGKRQSSRDAGIDRQAVRSRRARLADRWRSMHDQPVHVL